MLLLHALGISSEVLLKKQEVFLSLLRSASRGHVASIFQFLSFIDCCELAERLLLDGFGAVSEEVGAQLQREYARMVDKRKQPRCRIMVFESRLLLGVCDPFDAVGGGPRLHAGTCFIRVTDVDGQARTVMGMDVLVARNPCLHPGDLQRFRAVDVPELSYLVDCIVFPTVGRRPGPDLLSGGDLDGDQFTVIWDSELIPRIIAEPAEYPPAPENLTLPPHSAITAADRARHFAESGSSHIGAVKNLFLSWARVAGPMSSECQQLNRLYSLSVDGHEVCIPARLHHPPLPKPGDPRFILDVLHEAAATTIGVDRTLADEITSPGPDVTGLLVDREMIAMSEFELVQMAVAWCRRNGRDFRTVACSFHFGALTDHQQRWLIAALPCSQDLPPLVLNGLTQSRLILPDVLQRFDLGHAGLHWRCFFDSHSDSMRRFLQAVRRALGTFHKKLILMQCGQRLVVAIFIPAQVAEASDALVGCGIRTFAIPLTQGAESNHCRVVPTSIRYRLFCDGRSFQLFDGQRSNTFAYLVGDGTTRVRPAAKQRGRERRHTEPDSSDANKVDCRVSIALQKISDGLQSQMGRVTRDPVTAAVRWDGRIV